MIKVDMGNKMGGGVYSCWGLVTLSRVEPRVFSELNIFGGLAYYGVYNFLQAAR